MKRVLSHDRFSSVVLFSPMSIPISISGSLEGDETRVLSHDGLTEEAGVLFSLCGFIELADYTPGLGLRVSALSLKLLNPQP
jgi:hypothetical protein